MKLIRINKEDNVAVALEDIDMNEKLILENFNFISKTIVPKGHKIALNKIKKGGDIIKYANPIAYALNDIQQGEHIHTHNAKTKLSNSNVYSYSPNFNELKSKIENRTFKGYKRFDGSFGIRNEIWIIPTVGCVNGIAENIAKTFKLEAGINSEDLIQVFPHNYGCSQLGDDHKNTRTVLSNMATHPNAGAILYVGLGCENNQIDELKSSIGKFDEDRVDFMICQEFEDEISEGVKRIHNLYKKVKLDSRTNAPISELKIGLKCGASDGFSGITANPLLGEFSDYLIQNGGTTILTEVPEMFGAETLLMERAENKEVFKKIVNLINDFKEYFISHKQPVYENPSPGNKKGGITTLEDKSLGCTQKAGKAIVIDVLKYGERLKTKGLNLLSSPGNDLIASSALGFSGCQMVLFTTGRGTPFGSFIPTIKISTNSEIAQKKKHWIDFNAGTLLENENMEDLLEKFIDYIISVSNGEKVNHEKLNFREIAIFKTGVSL
jgi:altronate hydrolase